MDRTRKEAMVFLIIIILSAAARRLFSERSLYLSTDRPEMQRKTQRLHRYRKVRGWPRRPCFTDPAKYGKNEGSDMKKGAGAPEVEDGIGQDRYLISETDPAGGDG
jgi:hypothetical protein